MLGVVLEFEPNDPDALFAYGVTWIGDPGDPAPGVKALEKAVALDPRNEMALLNLVLLLIQAGDRDKARAVVEGPLARAGGNDALLQGRELLLLIDLHAADAAGRSGNLDEASRIQKWDDVLGQPYSIHFISWKFDPPGIEQVEINITHEQ